MFRVTILVGVLSLRAAVAVAGPDYRVVDAARMRQTEAILALIKKGADVNTPDPSGATPLQWAAHWNESEVVDHLLRAGARVNDANDYGATALWLSATNGSAAIVQRLLAAGANPNLALGTGETPLMAAVRSGDVPCVQALLAAHADLHAQESARGQNALMWAVAEHHPAVAELLLDRGANPDTASKSGFTALMFATRNGDLEVARLLVARGASVNAIAADKSTPLVIAIVRGHVSLAEYLLDHGADANAAGLGYTALHWAAGVWETSTTLDYNLTSGEWAALEGIPSRADKVRIIKALIAHGADVNARTTKAPPRYGFTQFAGQMVALVGATPFFIAALSGDAEVMRLLTAVGADPLQTTNDGNTALIVAAGRARVDAETRIPESRALEAVITALAFGVDVNATNRLGETALHAAALSGLDTVVQYLVDHGAAINCRTNEGKTPLTLTQGTIVSMQVVVRKSTGALLRKLGGEQ
jgi:ankyrin repeat protein